MGYLFIEYSLSYVLTQTCTLWQACFPPIVFLNRGHSISVKGLTPLKGQVIHSQQQSYRKKYFNWVQMPTLGSLLKSCDWSAYRLLTWETEMKTPEFEQYLAFHDAFFMKEFSKLNIWHL